MTVLLTGNNNIISNIQNFWYTHYNTNTSWLPLYIPLVGWFISYLYCILFKQQQQQQQQQNQKDKTTTNTTKVKQFQFNQWILIHNIHNIGTIVLGCISIYYNNNNIFNERISILFNLSYFIIDCIDCIVRFDFLYFIHSILCILLGYYNYTFPTLFLLRMNSKASFCELSTPFMHIAKKTKQPFHFILFSLIFTLCRILWIPFLYYQCCFPTDTTDRNNIIIEPLSIFSIPMILLKLFYILNCYWYYKILIILYNGLFGKNKHTTQTPTEKEK